LRGGDVVVEEAIQHPHFQRGIDVVGNQFHRARKMPLQVLDDASRLDHRARPVRQYREALHRPERGQFRVGLRVFQVAVVEGGAVLVQGHQHLLAVGRERMGVQAWQWGGHRKLRGGSIQ
jgi:hypothetical protein